MYKRVRQTNAWIEREGSVVRLMSYDTLVCEVHTDSKTVLLSPASRCSRTTIRHLRNFLSDFKISYMAVKPILMSAECERVTSYNGYTIYVSNDPRFRFRPTHPYCLL